MWKISTDQRKSFSLMKAKTVSCGWANGEGRKWNSCQKKKKLQRKRYFSKGKYQIFLEARSFSKAKKKTDYEISLRKTMSIKINAFWASCIPVNILYWHSDKFVYFYLGPIVSPGSPSKELCLFPLVNLKKMVSFISCQVFVVAHIMPACFVLLHCYRISHSLSKQQNSLLLMCLLKTIQ